MIRVSWETWGEYSLKAADIEAFVSRQPDGHTFDGDTHDDRLYYIVSDLLNDLTFEQVAHTAAGFDTSWDSGHSAKYANDLSKTSPTLKKILFPKPLTSLEEAALAQGIDLRNTPESSSQRELF